MVDAVKLYFSNYFNFKGRTSRRNFWLAVLGIIIIEFVLGFVCGLVGVDEKTSTLISSILSLALFIPNLSIEVRRLHDINKSGWWLLLCLTGIGAIVILVFFCLASVDEGNRFGAKDE